jgi:hypothetical protein
MQLEQLALRMRNLLRRSLFFLLLFALPFSLISCDSSGSNGGSDGSNGPDYNQVTVESITLNDFPATTDDGSPWDYSSEPDPGIQVVKAASGSVEGVTGSFTDISQGQLPIEYANNPFTIDDLSAEYNFDLYDDDTSEDDFIGGVVYDLSNLTDDYPESTTIRAGGISYTLELNWSE